MIGDHRRILATGIARLRAKIKYHPVVFELMPPVFTLLQLQRCVEAIAGLQRAQAEFPPPDRAAATRRGNRRDRVGHRRAPAKAFPLPPRRARGARRRRNQAAARPGLDISYSHDKYISDMLNMSISHDPPGQSTAPASRSTSACSRVIPPIEWPAFEADIDAILRLKRRAQRDHPRAQLSDAGDLPLRRGHRRRQPRAGARSGEERRRVIVLAGVHFMAETAKLLNPSKTVLIPDAQAGCSLAESIDADDSALLAPALSRRAVVTYVNTSAAVKAESDICCTSANAVKVVESLGAPRVIMLPDEYLAKNVAAQTKVEIIAWRGRCEVHERFTAADIRELREAIPAWSCSPIRNARPRWWPRPISPARPPTMIGYVGTKRPARVVLVTECSMSDNVAVQLSRLRIRAPVQSLPAHEAHHARQDPSRARNDAARGHDRSGPRRARAPRRRADAGAVTADAVAAAGASSSSAAASPA